MLKDMPGIGVGIMVLKNDRILLGKRHTKPEFADSELHGEGTWTMPGGKVEFRENLKEAAFREIFEETGVKIDIDKLKLISVSDDIVEDAHFVTVGFLLTEFTAEPKVMEPNEITEWRWFELENLPSPLFFPSEKVLENYQNRIIYA